MATAWRKYVQMLQVFSDLIRDDSKEVADGAIAQFEAIKTVFHNTPTWDEEAYDYLRDYTAFKVGEDNRQQLHNCLSLEDDSQKNKMTDQEIFDMLVIPESSGEKDSISTAPSSHWQRGRNARMQVLSH